MDGIDNWTTQERDDTDTLLEYVGPFAQDMVRRDGAVIPCGAGMSHAGVVEPVMTDPSGFASMDDAYGFLVDSVIENKGSWRAVCCVVAVTAQDGTDALRFMVDHASGRALTAVMVFRTQRFLDHVVFDDFVWAETPPLIWAD